MRRKGIDHLAYILLNGWKDDPRSYPHYMPAPTNNPASDTRLDILSSTATATNGLQSNCRLQIERVGSKLY
jgi:hypothetical protein